MNCKDTTENIKTNQKFVLMLTGNENHDNLDFHYSDDRVVSIIKNYPSIKNQSSEDGVQQYEIISDSGIPRIRIEDEDPRTFNIPLGFCNGFVPYNFANKKLHGGFVGQWTKNRELAVKAIDSYFQRNDQENPYTFAFYKGFGPNSQNNKENPSLMMDDYSFNLGGLETSFCFTGQSPETFRVVESAMSGCILIIDALPDIWYYKNIPALMVPYWADEVLIDLMRKINGSDYKLFSGLSSEWYVRDICPRSVGKKIFDHVSKF
tara:strand:+ start:168 stop:956 length:789 start_codon:yes stop_codon:yes gene_type:complete